MVSVVNKKHSLIGLRVYKNLSENDITSFLTLANNGIMLRFLLSYKIREILIKNSKEKSREIFRVMH